ncbi:hypothetical protein [Marilutibacter aestuarii]|uniref:hypothetical protein n=1 Tax=Marilutibacter aestuarii TaxID=1706195 RepID=UPI001476A361|nr:hypothetical protein [Lysobacter aestuarii]
MTPMDIKREFASWGPVREQSGREWLRLFGGDPPPAWPPQPAPVQAQEGAR